MVTKAEYIGYCEEGALPVKKGDKITLRKGMKYTHRGEERVVKRFHQVYVHHVLPGTTDTRNYSEPRHISNPTLRWAGAGGYWSAIDINEYLNWGKKE